MQDLQNVQKGENVEAFSVEELDIRLEMETLIDGDGDDQKDTW